MRLQAPIVLFVTLFATSASAQTLGCAVAGPATTMGFVSGADAWIGDHAGIRFELRDHVRPDDRGVTHYRAFRVGVAFR